MKFLFNGGTYPGILKAIEAAGHTVCRENGNADFCNWVNYCNDSEKNRYYNEVYLRDIVKRERPDVYFCAKGYNEASGLHVWPSTTQFIKDYVGTTIYWSQDDPNFIPIFIGKQLSTAYDLALTCATASFPDYQRVGIDPYLFWPAWDSVGRKYNEIPEKEKIDFAFVGTPYKVTEIPRAALVSGVLSVTKSVEVYGEYWDEKDPKRCMLASGAPELGSLYKGQWKTWGTVHNVFEKARLTFSNHIHRADMYLNDRVPMTMAVGCCTLVDRNPGLDIVFEHDKEVVFFDGYQDFLHKFKHFCSHPKESAEIGRNARKKILSEHTYWNRVEFLLDILATKGFK